MNAQYAPHGTFAFEWIGEVLRIQIIGAVNVEMAHDYVAALKSTVAARGLKRWGRIADLRQWGGMTPDAKIAYEALSDWYPTAGCIAHTQIYPSTFLKSLASTINASVARAGPVQQCASVEESLEWLKTFGLATGT